MDSHTAQGQLMLWPGEIRLRDIGARAALDGGNLRAEGLWERMRTLAEAISVGCGRVRR